MRESELRNLRKYVGDLSGIYGMQDFTYNEGKAKGMRGIQMRNGRGLSATLLPDRCLDIPYFSYKDTNLALLLRPGLSSPSYYNNEDGRGFMKQFNGGLLTTCGLTNAGAACDIDGQHYAVHGHIHNIPGENVNKEELSIDGNIVLQVSAEMREACVYGEYMVLRRKIKMETESNNIIIEDILENRGFAPAPLVMLYHFNFGYPLLDKDARVYFSTRDIAPRDEVAEKGLSKYGIIEEPQDGKPEECFVHTGGSGMQFGLLHNEKMGLAAAVHFNIDDLPQLCEWKSMISGDYALGLEPSEAGFWGLKRAKELGLIRYLGAGESKSYKLRVEVLDDKEAISALIAKCKA